MIPDILWARLTESAKLALIRVAQELVERHSGSIELHCLKGGVRLVRFGKEWRPAVQEYRPGVEDSGGDVS